AVAAPAGARSDDRFKTASAMRVLESQVLVDVNRVRAEHGLRPLRLSPKLSAAATQHSREMGRRGYFSHDSANGQAFWRRIESFYPSNGYRSWSVGENLLWSSPDVDAAGAVKLWMHSPEHRANLLSAGWREVGLSAVHVDSAPGTYHGLGVTIVTADFGARQR
ncbi:MAG TPA: CAP domain-containing protein, partial [Gaiellaceae bacterium]|nr:CAP domain-containing protein [Gaiellaceae bacterium]